MDIFDYYDDDDGEGELLSTRIYKDYSNPMEIYDSNNFFHRFRFHKEYVLFIHNELNFPSLFNNRGRPIPSIIQVKLFISLIHFNYFSIAFLVACRN